MMSRAVADALLVVALGAAIAATILIWKGHGGWMWPLFVVSVACAAPTVALWRRR